MTIKIKQMKKQLHTIITFALISWSAIAQNSNPFNMDVYYPSALIKAEIPQKQLLKSPIEKSLVQLIDSAYDWQWDTLAVAWSGNPYYKNINYVYDAHNNNTSYLTQTWSSGVWTNAA